MSDWSVLLYLVLSGLLVWMMVRIVRSNPESFTKAAFSQSAYTLGLLALGLIGFIALMIVFLKH